MTCLILLLITIIERLHIDLVKMKFQFLAIFCGIFDPGNVKKPSKKMGSPLSFERFLVGGFKDLLCSSLFGEDSDFQMG